MEFNKAERVIAWGLGVQGEQGKATRESVLKISIHSLQNLFFFFAFLLIYLPLSVQTEVMWASELRGQSQRRTCASAQSAAGALAEGEGGRGSLRGKRRSGGSWNSSNCCYHIAAHAREPAPLPARLSEGAGASGAKVLEGRRYSQEPSGCFIFVPFPAKNICLRTPLLSPDWKRYFVSLMCLFFESRYGICKKNNSEQDVKADVQRGGGFPSLPSFLVELRQ